MIGSAWMPCERPIAGVARCSSARRRQAARSRSIAGQDLVAASTSVERQRRVEHVGRRHAQVQPARRLAGQLLDVGQERDHVVARALLVLQDARGIQLAGGLGAARRRRSRPAPSRRPPSPRRRPARRGARSRSGGGRTRARPEFGTRVTGDHRSRAGSNEIAPAVQGPGGSRRRVRIVSRALQVARCAAAASASG